MKRVVSLAVCLVFLLGTMGAYAEEITGDDPAQEIISEDIIEPEEPAMDLGLSSYGSTYAVLSWNGLADEAYEVYRFRDGAYRILDTVYPDSDGVLKYRVAGLTAGQLLTCKVIRVSTGESEKVKCATKYSKVSGIKFKRMTGKCDKISYTAKKNATGYEVQYSENKNFDAYTSVSTANAYKKVYELKRAKRYYYRVRAYRTVDGVKYYGLYSDVKSFMHHDKERKNGATYFDGILVVNKTYSLSKSYGNGLKKSAKSAFNDMKRAARKKGISLWIASGYRTYSYQKSLYNSYKRVSGKYADTYSARPGHSEHQSGYGMDVNQVKDSFAYTKAGKWLAKNCYKYGFIIRYPKGKQKITGYKYEPWHVRYVGKTLAKKLYNGGDWITMEEYFGISSKY